MDGLIKCLVSIEHIFYPKATVQAGDWASFSCTLLDVYEGEPKTKRNGMLMVKGKVPELNFLDHYTLLAKHSFHEQYGHQYEVLHMNKLVNLTDEVEQRAFLEYILSEAQINSLYESLDNPFEIIKREDVDTLKTVKGIGESTALKIIQRYKDNIDNGFAYVELDSFGLTKYMIDKLIDVYGSANTLVSKIKENPYILIEEVDGIGWKKADEMALNGGLEAKSAKRINAYIVHDLKSIAEDGDTWVTAQELFQSAFDVLEIDDADSFRECMYDLHKKGILSWNEDKTRIGLTTYFELERHIAEDLIRLKNAENNFKYADYELKIKEIEEQQGWSFTDEQLQAIQLVLENQVSIITGYGGTGKSSVVYGVLKVLEGYSFAQTALSGRAASRLSEITSEDGYTIHRLLGYNPTEGFTVNRNNPLYDQIIILDEISMVGADLFYRLIQSIQSGHKLIMIGDDGQLESIGLCNIFKDMLESGVIAIARLTKIHRQAAKSAIITESIRVRNHEQLVSHQWVGEETRGELQDLKLNIFGDSILTQKRVIESFNDIYSQHPQIEDIQIVVPMKYRGNVSTLALNEIVQEIVNKQGANGITIRKKDKGEDITYSLREKDKVIVNKNNYKTKTPEGKLCPIFNGNKGTIQAIEKNYMVVDFEQWGEIVLTKGQWNNIELAYALSCHKLQGSEAKYVIIGLDFSARTLLTKEWLYTAITRAKKYCVLCAETKALSYCISNSNVPYKRTLLKDFLIIS